MLFEDMAFTCYVMRQQQIEDIIDDLVLEDDPYDETCQAYICGKHGVSFSTLTSYEKRYIEDEISKRG